MSSKWTLFTGIILLTIGIILRVNTDLGYQPIILIIVGALLKAYYIIGKARSGEYKPGYELAFLFFGLLLLGLGIYLRPQELSYSSSFLVVCGIIFKVVFVILFIVNIRSHRKKLNRK